MLSRKNNGSNSLSIISEGVKIEGKIHFLDSVKINGTVIGDIISENILTIGKEGKVESKIKARDAVISGRFEGEMFASGLVEIKSTGRFIGNLTQDNAMLSIEKGGLFKGKSMVTGKKEVLDLEDNSKILDFIKSKKEKIVKKEVKVAV